MQPVPRELSGAVKMEAPDPVTLFNNQRVSEALMASHTSLMLVMNYPELLSPEARSIIHSNASRVITILDTLNLQEEEAREEA